MNADPREYSLIPISIDQRLIGGPSVLVFPADLVVIARHPIATDIRPAFLLAGKKIDIVVRFCVEVQFDFGGRTGI